MSSWKLKLLNSVCFLATHFMQHTYTLFSVSMLADMLRAVEWVGGGFPHKMDFRIAKSQRATHVSCSIGARVRHFLLCHGIYRVADVVFKFLATQPRFMRNRFIWKLLDKICLNESPFNARTNACMATVTICRYYLMYARRTLSKELYGWSGQVEMVPTYFNFNVYIAVIASNQFENWIFRRARVHISKTKHALWIWLLLLLLLLYGILAGSRYAEWWASLWTLLLVWSNAKTLQISTCFIVSCQVEMCIYAVYSYSSNWMRTCTAKNKNWSDERREEQHFDEWLTS